MNNEHVISDEVLDMVRVALLNGENRMVYDNSLYFIEPNSIDFFRTKDEAEEFCQSNYSDHDCCSTLYIQSPEDLIKQIPYGNVLENLLNSTSRILELVNNYSIINQSFIMNEQNLQYLKDNIKYLGFGDKLYPELQSNMEQGLPEFQLKTQTEFNKDKIGAELYFKKSETNDMYFLNRYDAALEKFNGKKLSQPFYLNRGNGVTIKEAYNLLHGRAVNKDLVNKEGQKYNAWVQLDLKDKNERGNFETKQFHKNYGYDLEQSLTKFPIKELAVTEQKDALIKSLQKGNIQSATFQHNGEEQKMYVEANPQLKTVNIYDKDMKLQHHESLKKNQSFEQSNGMEQKQNVTQNTKDKRQENKQEISPSKS